MIKALKSIKKICAGMDEQPWEGIINSDLAREHDTAITKIYDIVDETLKKLQKDLSG
jgi:hypothetical protein